MAAETTSHDNTYLSLLATCLNEGVRTTNRTGVDTLSVFGRQVRYDLRKGFPLLTTKKVSFKSIAVELLWFLRGDTNVKFLQDNGVHIWDEWADKDGNLGPMYGHQLRNLEKITFLDKRNIGPQTGKYKWPETPVNIDTNSTNHNNLLGKRFKNNLGEYVVVREYKVPRSKENSLQKWVFDIQFTDTGYLAKFVTKRDVLNGSIRDVRAISVEGVGCVGEEYTETDKALLYQTWVGILKRCYNPSHSGYPRYGARNIKVCDDWLNFSQFCKDVKTLPNWYMKLEHPDEYSLDKDYYGADGYSKDTCIWLSKLEQNLNSENMVFVRATNPKGEEINTVGIRPLCDQFGFKPASIRNCLAGTVATHHGWKFEQIQLNSDSQKLLRVRRVDQLKKLIANIKHDPHSRRLILNAWNVMDLDQMALAPCHMTPVQFYVQNGELSCQLYQRSGDVFLGVPYNVASYSLLTHMIAQVCGLGVGEFVHTFGDLHLYTNHVEQAKQQLTRTPYAAPTLELSAKTDIDSFELSDFKLHNYISHPAIKAPVAV